MDIMSFKASRPKNMSLDVNKISTALNYDLPGIEDSLRLMKYQYDNEDSLRLMKYQYDNNGNILNQKEIE